MAVAYVELRYEHDYWDSRETADYFVSDNPLDPEDVARVEKVIEDADSASCDNGDECAHVVPAPIGWTLTEDYETGVERERMVGFFVVDGKAICEDCFTDDPFYADYEVGELR